MNGSFRWLVVLALLLVPLESRADAPAGPMHLTEFMVPARHHGPLIMVLCHGDGLKLPAAPGTWMIEFSAGGVVVVDWDTYLLPNHKRPPQRWKSIVLARYTDGAKLLREDEARDDEIAFRGAYGVGRDVETGMTSTGAVYYFVGTRAEADEFRKEQEKKFSTGDRPAASDL